MYNTCMEKCLKIQNKNSPGKYVGHIFITNTLSNLQMVIQWTLPLELKDPYL